MLEPKWFRVEAALIAHASQLKRHGGIEGVRDQGLLESALMRPRHLFAYSSPLPDLAALATCYAGGLVRNHPFLDGNKRTALVVCRAFLVINGFEIGASQAEKAAKVLSLAASELSEEEFAEWLRSRLIARRAKR
jgi:death-on-curing protein